MLYQAWNWKFNIQICVVVTICTRSNIGANQGNRWGQWVPLQAICAELWQCFYTQVKHRERWIGRNINCIRRKRPSKNLRKLNEWNVHKIPKTKVSLCRAWYEVFILRANSSNCRLVLKRSEKFTSIVSTKMGKWFILMSGLKSK